MIPTSHNRYSLNQIPRPLSPPLPFPPALTVSPLSPSHKQTSVFSKSLLIEARISRENTDIEAELRIVVCRQYVALRFLSYG